MPEPLPPLNARLLERYVEARIARCLIGSSRSYWVGGGDAHGTLWHAGRDCRTERALVADAERAQRKDGEEIKMVSWSGLWKETHHG